MLNALKYPPSAHPFCVGAQAHLLKLQLITCTLFMPLTILLNSTTQCSLHLETFPPKALQMHCLQSWLEFPSSCPHPGYSPCYLLTLHPTEPALISVQQHPSSKAQS